MPDTRPCLCIPTCTKPISSRQRQRHRHLLKKARALDPSESGSDSGANRHSQPDFANYKPDDDTVDQDPISDHTDTVAQVTSDSDSDTGQSEDDQPFPWGHIEVEEEDEDESEGEEEEVEEYDDDITEDDLASQLHAEFLPEAPPTDPRLRLFQFQIDTFTREHLSTMVNSIAVHAPSDSSKQFNGQYFPDSSALWRMITRLARYTTSVDGCLTGAMTAE
ncbi:hypothetical protein JB92DRAFT_3122275 [Gautieria morchelliformis]|nr:hypothetical protein JB92DRAFT_3122275 [Gautieria morchelliformis]